MRAFFSGWPAVSFVLVAACGYDDHADLFALGNSAKDAGGSGGSSGAGGSSTTAGNAAGGSNDTGGSGTGGSSDTGGSNDTGGSSGTGGSTGPNTDSFDLIDDMEQTADAGTSRLPRVNGRTGNWFTYQDPGGGGQQQPGNGRFTFYEIVPARGDSHWSARTYGSEPAQSWGAQLAATLMNPAAPYDASKYTGIHFFAQAIPGKTTAVSVSFRESRTAPPSAGGTCTNNAICYNDFAKDITLGTSWQEVRVLFADATSQTASLGALDASHLITILFSVAGGTTYDFWIDDLAFICKNAGCT
jgi:hypothetical protein